MNHALALMLLMGPGEPPIDHISDCERFELTEEIKSHAINLGILDKRELPYFFIRDDEFESDLGLLRRRWSDLRDAPQIEFFDSFPSRQWCSEQCELNRSTQRWLEGEMLIQPHREFIFWMAMRENDLLYQFWDHLRDARNENYYLSSRRAAGKQALQILHQMGYSPSSLPPAIPVWRWDFR